MEIRLVNIENCGGVTLTVSGHSRASRILEVKIEKDISDRGGAESSDDAPKDASGEDRSPSSERHTTTTAK